MVSLYHLTVVPWHGSSLESTGTCLLYTILTIIGSSTLHNTAHCVHRRIDCVKFFLSLCSEHWSSPLGTWFTDKHSAGRYDKINWICKQTLLAWKKTPVTENGLVVMAPYVSLLRNELYLKVSIVHCWMSVTRWSYLKSLNGLNPFLESYFSIKSSYSTLFWIALRSGSPLTVVKLSKPFSNANCRLAQA